MLLLLPIGLLIEFNDEIYNFETSFAKYVSQSFRFRLERHLDLGSFLKYLKSENIDVRHLIPLGSAIVVVSVEAHTGIVANGLGQKPRVIVLAPHHQGGQVRVPQEVEARPRPGHF